VGDFYKNGLAFGCTRCSNCCRYQSGYVFLSKADVVRLTTHLAINEEEFLKQCCRTVSYGNEIRLSLIEKANLDCYFYNNDIGGCAVYPSRPLQCKLYPFWETMLNADSWQLAKNSCNGLDNGPFFSKEEIEEFLIARRIEPLINLKP
jgi:Fe-S-cluster containining protein